MSETKDDFQELSKPIRKILKYLGSWPRKGDQFILRLNFWNGFTLFILHFYTVHKFFNWMTVVKYTKDVFAVFEQLTLIVRTGVVAITFDRRFLLHNNLMRLFDDISDFPLFNTDHRITNLQRKVKYIIITCWTFIALHVVLAASLMFYKSTDGYVNWLFYGDAAENAHEAIVRTAMILDWGLYLFLVICNECYSQAFYVTICLVVREQILDYNDFLIRLHDKKLITTAEQVQELYRLNSKLSTIVERVEDNFSFPVLMWVACIVFNICVKIEAVISGIRKAQFEEFGYIILDIIYYITAFITMCLIASEIGEEKVEPIVAVTKMCEDGVMTDWTFQQESQMLLAKLNTRMMKLTGWNCFELNKSFMITILGAIATYAIFLLQM